MHIGTVFDIQHYAVHDGPGIRTLVFLKGCPLHCAWCCNPESQDGQGELKYSKAFCQKCFTCAASCPERAITHGNAGPEMDRSACAKCRSRDCIDACNHSCISWIGRDMTVEQVMERVRADKAFYDRSSGGVTFSGGEPTQQPEFLQQLLEACEAEQIHRAVETCGYVSNQVLRRLEPLISLFLFDIKVLDEQKHQKWTGKSNRIILENLRTLAERRSEDTVLRYTLIPGVNDSENEVRATAAMMVELGLTRIELSHYHPYGMAKDESLGHARRDVMVDGMGPEARMNRAAMVLSGEGLDVDIA